MRPAAFGFVFVALAATAAASGCGSASLSASAAAADGGTGGGGGDGSFGTGAASGDFQLLAFSDWHGQLDSLVEKNTRGDDVEYGGLAVLSAYFKAERAKNPSTLLFTAGDVMGATPALSSLFDDRPAIEALNFLQLTATTFGNHDFDRGPIVLKDRVGEAKFKYVTSNVGRVNEVLGTAPVSGFYLVEVGASVPRVRVGVVGVTNPDAPSMVYPGRMGGMTVSDPVAATNKAAADARAAGADVVVALAHLGVTSAEGAQPAGPLVDYAKAISNVDIVLGDHTNQVVNARVGKALVLENKSKGRTYARVRVSVRAGAFVSANAEIVDTARAAVTPDPDAEALIAPYRAQLSARLDDKVAVVSQVYAQDGVTERKSETALGDLVADAMLARYRGEGAQIAFTNAGGLRASLPSSHKPADMLLRRPDAGYAQGPPFDVVAADLLTMLPFGNTCVVRKISGTDLWAVLEHSVAALPNADGRFLQIAGFKLEYSLSAAPGQRVRKVTLDDGAKDVASNDATLYTIVTNDFTNAGGDGYTMLASAPATPPRDVLADVVTDYLRARSPLVVPTAGRITQLQ
jgi:5'-nucleotidase